MPKPRRRLRGASLALLAGALATSVAACGADDAQEPPSPTAEPTTETTEPEPTPEPSSDPPTETEEPIAHAGEDVDVKPGDTVPFYDITEDFDHPPKAADFRVTGLDWEWSPAEGASDMCEYDPSKGQYVGVQIELDATDKARSYGTPFSGKDLMMIDDSGEVVGTYQDWDSRACADPGDEMFIDFEPNSSHEGTMVFLLESDATQLRLDFEFDREDSAPTFLWTLSDF